MRISNYSIFVYRNINNVAVLVYTVKSTVKIGVCNVNKIFFASLHPDGAMEILSNPNTVDVDLQREQVPLTTRLPGLSFNIVSSISFERV